MKEIPIVERSQTERMLIAESLVDNLWCEIKDGQIEDRHGLLQLAVYLQTNTNRIVWYLNQKAEEEE